MAGGISRKGGDMGAFDLGVSHERLGERGELVLVRIAGEIDVYSHVPLRDYLRAEVLEAEEAPEYVGMEVSEVGWLDSTALGVFVGLLQRFRKLRPEGGVVIVAPIGETRRIFEITGLTKVFPLVGSVEEFLAFVAKDRSDGAEDTAPVEGVPGV